MSGINEQIRRRPVIRVFISSTFSDLKHERNALQEQVFPKLEQLCARNDFQFQAIDLRWGVSSEAGLDHRTMRICFDELRRAQEISPRPNFLILLGNRYGWRPLPEEISLAEFQALERAAAQVATTTDQPAAAVLQAWYRRDENAIPPVYLLQSRRQQLPDAKDYTQDAPWNEVQAILWEIINRAHPPEQLRGRFDAAALAEGSPPAIVRFQASATEQEIWHGALRVPDAQEHVLAFFRQIENVAEFSDPAQIKNFVDLEPSGTIDVTLGAEQERLKEALRKRLGSANVFESLSARLVPVRDALGQPTVDVTRDHLAQLCTDVEKRLTEIIQGQIGEYWNKTAQASAARGARELKIEQDEYERFGRERGGADSFVGRKAELQAIHDYLQSDSLWPLVVHGASGCGKTALLARAAEQQKIEVRGQRPEVIVRYIGVTPRSSDIRSLLGSLCQELRLRHPREGELPTDIKGLGEELQEHFRSAMPEQPLILFLDALDQLSDTDNGPLLNWIPTGQLSSNVKLVVSCLSDRAKDDPAGQPFAELTRRQLPAENIINLDALSEDEARALLFDRWLPQAGRTTSRDQRERIGQRLKSEGCRQPIYLKLLFEEARLWRSFDAAPESGESVPAILGQLFKRLSQPANHGPLLVERVLGYLAASRHGLAENEILEVLFADADYKAALDQATEQTRHELPARATRIPIAIWSRLRFDLAPYLTERAAPGANVLTFYHRQVAEWVQEHFVKTSEHSWQPHRRLADYFTACAKGTAEEWETDSVRGFAECVYQLIKAGQYEQAAGLLSHFPFLLHKLRVGLLEGVFEDYDMVRHEAPTEVARRLDIWADFFREKMHILRRGNDEWPTHKILLQLAIEHADDSPLTIAAEKWLKENQCDWLWLRRVPRFPHAEKNPCLAVLEGHSSLIWGACALADGRILSWSGDKTLRVWDARRDQCLNVLEGHSNNVMGALALADGKIVSWSGDNTLRLWDTQRGHCLAVLEGHSEYVGGALALANARILSWSGDKTLRLWDAQHGHCLAVLEGHSHYVKGALALSDGKILSWADDNLVLWDAQSGHCLAVLEGHSHWVLGALALADGKILSWAGDKTLRFWDMQLGECLAVLEGHTVAVEGALPLADGRILSWSGDHTLRLWNAQSSQCVAVLEGHSYLVRGALALADGRILSWAKDILWGDKTLRLWDAQRGQCLAVLEGHSHAVNGALTLADGRILSWSQDKTLRLWDAQSGQCLTVFEGHARAVSSALALADGRILSWSGDNTLRLWEAQRGQCLAKPEGHAGRVSGALALADGRILSWAADIFSKEKNLRLWDTQSGQSLAVLVGHSHWVLGALTLSDGRILSFSADKTLRLWDAQHGQCLAVLEGHSDWIRVVFALADGKILSSSSDKTLRLWDAQSYQCLAILEGHSNWVDALALADDRILSWSGDKTLRLWDAQRGQCLAVLEGHSDEVWGALALSDGRILSWSKDKTLRLWDGQRGQCLAMFEGHSDRVCGAMALADGKILSWAGDQTLRLWDGQLGQCIAVLEGHSGWVRGALVLADGKILSWSDDNLTLWDAQRGKLLEMVSESHVSRTHPEWLHARERSRNSSGVCSGYFADSHGRSISLRHKSIGKFPTVVWNTDSNVSSRVLSPDGTVVLTEDSGQVCFLKLHHGNLRVSLAEVEKILFSQKKTAK
jgi:WD40 repeat protein